MQILNVRFGLATNSSSSHSMVFIPKGRKIEDDYQQDDGDFGWQKFTLTSTESKLRYLGCLLKDRLIDRLPMNVAKLVHESWLDTDLEENDYIDHESHYYIPSAFGTNIPDEKLIKELKEFFAQDGLAILGGNDNESTSHPLYNKNSFGLPIPKDCGHQAGHVCRYDEKYKFWTIFCPHDGTKIRFRLTNNVKEMKVKTDKSLTPELIDIKITNYCSNGCQFCYQSSNEKGKHANSYDLYMLAKELAKMKVFEVAIGGGEPTSHPDFEHILENFRKNGIVPNFTTRNLNWLRIPKKARRIIEACGAFAYSISDPKDAYGEYSINNIRELITLLDVNEIPHGKAVIQLVMGTMNKHVFERILKEINEKGLSLTLLGYKNVGLGADFTPLNYGWWVDCVNKAIGRGGYKPKISIDTILAAEYEEELLAAKIPRWMFDVKEGGFSCYIDMVSNKIGPSSYCDSSEMKSFPDHRDNTNRYDVILNEFAKF